MPEEMASVSNRAGRRLLIIGDSTADPRREVQYRDTWICLLKAALPNVDVIPLLDGGRTTDYLCLYPRSRPDGSVEYDPCTLETFEPEIVVLNLGIVDCAPRLFSYRESYFLERMPQRLRGWIIAAAKRVRTRNDKRAYVDAGRFEKNLRQYFERCKVARVERLVVIGILYPDGRAVASNPGLTEAVSRYNAIYRRLCKEYDFAVFVEPLREQQDGSHVFIEDGYHPSAGGHAAIFQSVAQILHRGRMAIDASEISSAKARR